MITSLTRVKLYQSKQELANKPTLPAPNILICALAKAVFVQKNWKEKSSQKPWQETGLSSFDPKCENNSVQKIIRCE